MSVLLLCGGCSGPHSALDPATPQARATSLLWWLFLGVSVIVFAAVTAVVIGIIARPKDQSSDVTVAPSAPVPQTERRATRVVTGAVVVTVVVLFGLLVADGFTDRALGPLSEHDALTIKITGHQWWWQVEYQDPSPANIIQTANEIHVPVGRPLRFMLQSTDVIHSFWVPNLQGKKDLIPGHPTSLWLQLDRPGTFQGQCAEFCGYQHAHMGLRVVAESPKDFAAWQEAQRQTPPEPANDSQRHGRDIFLNGTCALCHTVDGTLARSRVGPPLTHLASQQMIAAETFANTREQLARWVRDAPSMKPGVHMPQNFLSDGDLNALLDYLQSLH